MSEFMKFESTKSIRRWRPPKGTADFERSRVRGCRRSPRPPAMIIASRRARRGIPGQPREMADPLGLGAVDAVPRPLGVGVEPHAMVAALAPRAFGQRQRRARWHDLERFTEGHARNAGARHLARDMLEPERPLEPPV